MASELATLTNIEQSGSLNPIQRTRLDELRQMGSIGNPEGVTGGPIGSSGSSLGSSSAAIAEAIKQQQEAIKPAIESYKASIPETQQVYAQSREQLQAKQEPMEQRYQNLLDSIRSQGEQDINTQTRITSSELGKRGLTGSSTLSQQEIQNAVSPLRQKYIGLEKDTGLAREDALRTLQEAIINLTGQETGDLRAIQNAMAQLQAGAAQTGGAQGLQLYSTELQNQQQQRAFEEQKRMNDLAAQLQQYQMSQAQQPNYITLGEGQTLFDPSSGQPIYSVPKTYKSVQSSLGWE